MKIVKALPELRPELRSWLPRRDDSKLEELQKAAHRDLPDVDDSGVARTMSCSTCRCRVREASVTFETITLLMLRTVCFGRDDSRLVGAERRRRD
jgi:hypothetical protein